MDWTPEHDALLLKGLKQKLSASQIAAQLKVSRNAVIGRGHRLRGTHFPCDVRKKEGARRCREETQHRREARSRMEENVIACMLATLASGKPRNPAIVVARNGGVRFRALADALGLHPERVRQIVDAA